MACYVWAMRTVAFLGLGKMGSGMARRFLDAGFALRVFARTESKAAALVAAGATYFATARAACDGVDAVVSMVSDDVASRAVWLGPDGALAAATSARAFAIECSTLSRGWVLELAQHASARRLRYVDAPVTGLPEAARAGALTLLVGADARDLADAQALLSVVAQGVLHFGPVGAGTAYKLMINLLGAVQIASLAEGLALAERAGLDLAAVVSAIETSQAASPQVVRNAKRMLADDHEREVAFTPALRLKDVRYALELAREAGVDVPFGAVAASMFSQLNALHPGEINESKVIEVARGHGREDGRF